MLAHEAGSSVVDCGRNRGLLSALASQQVFSSPFACGQMIILPNPAAEAEITQGVASFCLHSLRSFLQVLPYAHGCCKLSPCLGSPGLTLLQPLPFSFPSKAEPKLGSCLPGTLSKASLFPRRSSPGSFPVQ